MSARVSRENPWPGLEAYEEADADLFFGRDAEKTALRRLVQQNPLVIVYGISGLGKTSLLQAGLFPLLRADDFLPILLRLGRQAADGAASERAREAAPGPAYADGLVRQVRSQTEKAGGRAPEPCQEGGTLWEYFHRSKSQFWSARTRLLTPVLVLDQFEEFFIAEGKSDAEHTATERFFAELADLVYCRRPDAVVQRLESGGASPDSYVFGQVPLRVVISMREDFLPQLSQMGRRRFPTLLDAIFRLRPLGTEAARACIEGPAPDLFEPDAVAPLVKFLANAEKSAEEDPAAAGASSTKWVEPALLSIVCRELNERRGREKISADLLKGSKHQILADFYERSWKGVAPELRKYVESNLVTQGGFRQALAVDGALEQPGVTPEDIETLVERRILHYQDRQEGPRSIELTHDLLCRVALASRNSRERAEQESKATEEARRAEERAAAAEAAMAEEERRRKQAERMRKYLALALLVSVIGTVLALYSMREATTANRAARRATAGANEIINTIRDRLRVAYAEKHDLQLVADIDQHVVDSLQKMYADRPNDANGQGEIAEYLDQVGDAQFAMGQLGEARQEYQDAFEIRSRIAKRPGPDSSIQASLADSNDNLGQMNVAEAKTLDPATEAKTIQDDLAKALGYFNAALQIRERLSPADSGPGPLSEAISRSYELMGDADEAEAGAAVEEAGAAATRAETSAIALKFEAALQQHRKALDVAQAGDSAAPGSAEYYDRLSGQGKIDDFIGSDQEEEGEFIRDKNKMMDALRAYGDAYKIRDYLCRVDSRSAGNAQGTGLYALGNNFEWADDLSESADHIGDVYWALGDLEMALAWHVMCIDIKKDLANKDPNNADWQAELSSSYDHAAEIAETQGDAARKAGLTAAAMKSYDAARGYYQSSLDIDASLASLDPKDSHRLRNKAESYEQVAAVLADEAALQPADGRLAQQAAAERAQGDKILDSLKEGAADKVQAIHDAVRELQH